MINVGLLSSLVCLFNVHSIQFNSIQFSHSPFNFGHTGIWMMPPLFCLLSFEMWIKLLIGFATANRAPAPASIQYIPYSVYAVCFFSVAFLYRLTLTCFIHTISTPNWKLNAPNYRNIFFSLSLFCLPRLYGKHNGIKKSMPKN